MTEIKEQILQALEDNANALEALAISKLVFGKDATKKQINRHLYALEREGKLTRDAKEDTPRPLWKLAPSEPS